MNQKRFAEIFSEITRPAFSAAYGGLLTILTIQITPEIFVPPIVCAVLFFSGAYFAKQKFSDENLIYFVGSILSLLAALAFWFYNFGDATVVKYLIALCLAPSIALSFRSKWKISMHATAFTTAIGYASLVGPGVPLLLLLPVVWWDRLKLKVHTPLQLAAGTILGALVSYSIFAFL